MPAILLVLLAGNTALSLAEETAKTSKVTVEANQEKIPTSNSKSLLVIPSKWEAGFKESMHEASIEALHEKKGDKFMRARDFDAAISEYKKAFDVFGTRGLLRNLAEAYEAKGDYETALAYLQELLEHWPSPVTRPRGVLWENALEAANQGHFDQAAKIYESLLANAEDWERTRLQQRLDAMRAHTNPASQKTSVRADYMTPETSVITDYIVSGFKKKTGVNLQNNKMAYQRIREAAEKARGQLQTLEETEVYLPFITADQSGPKHLSMTITREELRKFSPEKSNNL